VPRVRVAPDLFGLLRVQGLECDRVHGGDGGKLNQTLYVGVMKLRGDTSECVEARHE